MSLDNRIGIYKSRNDLKVLAKWMVLGKKKFLLIASLIIIASSIITFLYYTNTFSLIAQISSLALFIFGLLVLLIEKLFVFFYIAYRQRIAKKANSNRITTYKFTNRFFTLTAYLNNDYSAKTYSLLTDCDILINQKNRLMILVIGKKEKEIFMIRFPSFEKVRNHLTVNSLAYKLIY